MFKRNLILIAIVAFSLVFTSNAFSQLSATTTGIKSPRVAKSTKSKAPKNVVSGQSSQRTKIKKQITHDNEFENTIKRPSVAASRRSAGKRQHQPIKGYQLGDTATHERKRRVRN